MRLWLVLVLTLLSAVSAAAMEDWERERRRAPADVQKYREMVQEDPRNYEAFNNLGVALYLLARYQEALGAYRQSIHLKPGYTVAHSNLGNLLYDLKRYGEALAEYRTAIRLDPHNPFHHYNLANSLAGLGRRREAIEEIELYLKSEHDVTDVPQVRERLQQLRRDMARRGSL